MIGKSKFVELEDASESLHQAVMLEEAVKALDAEKGGVYLDCTLGGAGHARAILEAHPSNRVFAIDRDQRAISRAKFFLADYANRIELVHAMFSDLGRLYGERVFNGILVDCGISTDQLRESRGFSFFDMAGLDMRMDESQSMTAADLVNEASPSELLRIFRRGGVQSEAAAIVRAIVDARPISSTRELAELIVRCAKGKTRNLKIHPATVVFQALRMAVNSELEELNSLLEVVPRLAAPGARFVSITFHSIEEKLLTKCMRSWEQGVKRPASWAGAMDEKPSLGKLLTSKAIEASKREVERNPSARSAKLRIFEFSGGSTGAFVGTKGSLASAPGSGKREAVFAGQGRSKRGN